MNDAETMCVNENNNMPLRLGRTPVRPRCYDRDDQGPIPARVPGGFVVDLLEGTGPMDRDEAGLVLSWLEFVEREATEADLLEGIGPMDRGEAGLRPGCFF